MRALGRAGVVLVLTLAGISAGLAAGSAQSPPGHHVHRTPADWKFAWPQGDPARGRDAFAKFECYRCHEVKGERFSGSPDADSAGPELSAMGPLHDELYFAEAIINPSATIEPGRGWQAPDGSSKMPSFNDSMTVQELIDLVSYLRGLKPPPGTPPGPGAHPHGRH